MMLQRQMVVAVICLVSLSLTDASPFTRRIVNGEKAELYEFPSIASLQSDGRHICGAVVLNNYKVLTAAHCTEGERASKLTVVFGALNLTEQNPYKQRIRVLYYYNHLRYDPYARGMPNDISIITLESPVMTNNNVQFAKLPAKGTSFAGETCIIAGWGMTSATSSGATHLKKAKITKIRNSVCASLWYPQVITQKQICVLEESAPIGQAPAACMGDSGGPMYCGPNFEYVAGVTSWGQSSCEGTLPEVYTRVSEYLDWIQQYG